MLLLLYVGINFWGRSVGLKVWFFFDSVNYGVCVCSNLI